VDSVKTTSSVEERNEKLKEVTKHPFFRRAHPREEHFVPIYIAAGAGSGEGDGASVLSDIHSAISIAFGV
jgi:aromatic ring-opening dioxygenase catalytic subunit (LigB family)